MIKLVKELILNLETTERDEVIDFIKKQGGKMKDDSQKKYETEKSCMLCDYCKVNYCKDQPGVIESFYCSETYEILGTDFTPCKKFIDLNN